MKIGKEVDGVDRESEGGRNEEVKCRNGGGSGGGSKKNDAKINVETG